MNIHNIILHGYKASAEPPGALYLGTTGSRGSEQLRVTPGEGWEDLAVRVIFHPCRVSMVLPEDGILNVPWEATAKQLVFGQGRIVFQGVREGVIKISTDVQYRLEGHSPVDGCSNPQEPTPGVVEQVLAKMEESRAEISANAFSAKVSEESASASAKQALDVLEKLGDRGFYNIGSGLKVDTSTNTLMVDTADTAEQDNTKPITSAGVYTLAGNIEVLLAAL